MPLILTYPATKPNFPRAYVKGFITGTFIDAMSLSGETLLLQNFSLNLLYSMPLQHRFFTPSSNVYSLDYVFDAAACNAFISGVPITTGAQISFVADPHDFSWRIRVFTEPFASPPLVADLPPLAGYWLTP